MMEEEESAATGVAAAATINFAAYMDAVNAMREAANKGKASTSAATTSGAGAPPPRSAPPPVPSTASRPKLSSHSAAVNPFDAPDTPEHIIYGEMQEGRKSVKGATLPKLIAMITHPSSLDPTMLSSFLLTYRSFCSGQEAMDLLHARFNMPPPSSQEDHSGWVTTLKIIRLRVIALVKIWITEYPHEWVDDAELRAAMIKFLDETLPTAGMEKSAAQLRKLFDACRDRMIDKDHAYTFSNSPPPINLGKKMPKNPALIPAGAEVFDFPPEEVARQITLAEYAAYRRIRAWELLSHVTSKDKARDAPNICAMIDRFNNVSMYIVTSILQGESDDERLRRLKFWLSLIPPLTKLRNFEALMQVLSGVANSSVYRLKYLWKDVGKDLTEAFREAQSLMSPEMNFTTLRQHVLTCTPPIIPYLGMYLTDLTFTGDGNKDFLDEDKRIIHFAKRTMLCDTIRQVQQFQQQPYNLTPVMYIQELMDTCVVLDQNEAYALSIEILPRGAKAPPKKGRRDSSIRRKSTSRRRSVTAAFSRNNGSSSAGPPQSVGQTNASDPMDDRDKIGENIVLRSIGDGKEQLVAATPSKLIERATPKGKADSHFVKVFLCTFPALMSVEELLELLRARVDVPCPANLSAAQHSRRILSMQLRGFNFLKTWVNAYWQDFAMHEARQQALLAVLEVLSANRAVAGSAGALRTHVMDLIETGASTAAPSAPADGPPPPPPIVPAAVEAITELCDIDAMEVSRQLWLRHWAMYVAVDARVLVHHYTASTNGTGGDGGGDGPLETLLGEGEWLTGCVLRYVAVAEGSAEERARRIKHLVDVLSICFALLNCVACASIVRALRHPCVAAMADVWALVPTSSVDTLKSTAESIAEWEDAVAMSEFLDERSDDAILPYFPVLANRLETVFRLPVHYQDSATMVAFDRCRKIHMAVKYFTRWAKRTHHFVPVESVAAFLDAWESLPKSEWDALSPSLPPSTPTAAATTTTTSMSTMAEGGAGVAQSSTEEETRRAAMLEMLRTDEELKQQAIAMLLPELQAEVKSLREELQTLRGW